MMWGSWAVLDHPPQEIDRRDRSRIVVPDACATLYSAPIFNLGAGNPFEIVENLRTQWFQNRGRGDSLQRSQKYC